MTIRVNYLGSLIDFAIKDEKITIMVVSSGPIAPSLEVSTSEGIFSLERGKAVSISRDRGVLRIADSKSHIRSCAPCDHSRLHICLLLLLSFCLYLLSVRGYQWPGKQISVAVNVSVSIYEVRDSDFNFWLSVPHVNSTYTLLWGCFHCCFIIIIFIIIFVRHYYQFSAYRLNITCSHCFSIFKVFLLSLYIKINFSHCLICTLGVRFPRYWKWKNYDTFSGYSRTFWGLPSAGGILFCANEIWPEFQTIISNRFYSLSE